MAASSCGGQTYPRLSPGGQTIQQNITFAPLTTASTPAQVSRTAGLPGTITAAFMTHSISVTNGPEGCVTEDAPGGFVQGAMQYAFNFVALAGAPANCTQSVTITVDGDVIVFYLVVP